MFTDMFGPGCCGPAPAPCSSPITLTIGYSACSGAMPLNAEGHVLTVTVAGPGGYSATATVSYLGPFGTSPNQTYSASASVTGVTVRGSYEFTASGPWVATNKTTLTIPPTGPCVGLGGAATLTWRRIGIGAIDVGDGKGHLVTISGWRGGTGSTPQTANPPHWPGEPPIYILAPDIEWPGYNVGTTSPVEAVTFQKCGYEDTVLAASSPLCSYQASRIQLPCWNAFYPQTGEQLPDPEYYQGGGKIITPMGTLTLNCSNFGENFASAMGYGLMLDPGDGKYYPEWAFNPAAAPHMIMFRYFGGQGGLGGLGVSVSFGSTNNPNFPYSGFWHCEDPPPGGVVGGSMGYGNLTLYPMTITSPPPGLSGVINAPFPTSGGAPRSDVHHIAYGDYTYIAGDGGC